MKTLRLLLCILIIAVSLLALRPFMHTQPVVAPIAATADTSKTVAAPPPVAPIPLAPLATQLGVTLQTLVGPSPTQPATATDKDEDASEQITETFATDILNTLAKAVDGLKAYSTVLTTNAAALPDFSDWLSRQSSDPHRALLWDTISNDSLIIVGVPLLIGIAIMLLLIPLRLKLRHSTPDTLPERIGVLIGLFALRLVPAVAFLGASLMLLDQNEPHRLARFVILNVIYALSLGYTVQQVLRSLFAPTAPQLRTLPLTTPQAVSSYRWLSAFSFIIIYCYFLIDVSADLHVPATAVVGFQNLFAIILTVMAVTVIFRTRDSVAAVLRGNAEEEETPSFGHALRAWLAQHWHNLATAYLIVSLTVTVLGIENGLALMLRGTILSIFILTAARFGFVAIDKWKAPRPNGTLLIHRQLLSFLLRPALWGIAALSIAVTWGFSLRGFIATPTGQRLFGAFLSIALTLLALTVLYEMLHNSIERHLNRRDKISKLPVATARARTLLPMMRTSVFILFSAIAALTCLSAVGINIAPLLAGAGVVGVAIGFGSQTLVKDFLTGLFIVVENTIAVGDVVQIGTNGGVVETLSIRTIRLRDGDGSLHIIPFSEVTQITNMTRGFAYALVDIGVSYDSDVERVMAVMREVGASLQEDPLFKRVITEPIEVMGIERFADSSIIIRARIRTRPGKQWDVKRLLLLRIKQRFDKEGIEMPYPTMMHLTKMEVQKAVPEVQKPAPVPPVNA
jgi:small conductance mechanosensitive channel